MSTKKRKPSSKSKAKIVRPSKHFSMLKNAEPARLNKPETAAQSVESYLHKRKKGVLCQTDKRGHASPRDRSPLEIVVDASEGFVPLWSENTTLRWRFQESSVNEVFVEPEEGKTYIRYLMGEALLRWGDATPVKFSERDDVWDFEIVVRSEERCSMNGCVLASAFFPDAGRHELVIYPTMFDQDLEEQLDTIIHEIGHIFGLRHFFANLRETGWASEIFGTHNEYSIMNYGEKSVLTETDKSDLKTLYEMVWSGDLTDINGTQVKLVQPYSHDHQCAGCHDNANISAQPSVPDLKVS